MSTISRPTREKKKNPILDEYLDDDDMQLISTTPITNNLSRNRVKKPITKHRTSKKYRFEEIIESNPDHLAMIKLCKNGNAGTEGSSTRFNVKDSVYVVHDTLSGKANFRGEIVTRVIYKWKSKGQEVRYDVDYDDKDKDFGCDDEILSYDPHDLAKQVKPPDQREMPNSPDPVSSSSTNSNAIGTTTISSIANTTNTGQNNTTMITGTPGIENTDRNNNTLSMIRSTSNAIVTPLHSLNPRTNKTLTFGSSTSVASTSVASTFKPVSSATISGMSFAEKQRYFCPQGYNSMVDGNAQEDPVAVSSQTELNRLSTWNDPIARLKDAKNMLNEAPSVIRKRERMDASTRPPVKRAKVSKDKTGTKQKVKVSTKQYLVLVASPDMQKPGSFVKCIYMTLNSLTLASECLSKIMSGFYYLKEDKFRKLLSQQISQLYKKENSNLNLNNTAVAKAAHEEGKQELISFFSKPGERGTADLVVDHQAMIRSVNTAEGKTGCNYLMQQFRANIRNQLWILFSNLEGFENIAKPHRKWSQKNTKGEFNSARLDFVEFVKDLIPFVMKGRLQIGGVYVKFLISCITTTITPFARRVVEERGSEVTSDEVAREILADNVTLESVIVAYSTSVLQTGYVDEWIMDKKKLLSNMDKFGNKIPFDNKNITGRISLAGKTAILETEALVKEDRQWLIDNNNEFEPCACPHVKTEATTTSSIDDEELFYESKYQQLSP